MSSLLSLAFGELSFHQLLAVAVVVLILLFFASLKLLFGSFNIWTVISEHNSKSAYTKAYLSLFDQRNELLYHIGRCDAREDHKEKNILLNELEALDTRIDKLEAEGRSKQH